MTKKFNWMPILRTGTFTDKNKQTVSISESDLDKIVASTDLTKEPQLVIEHPKFDELGFGTIEKLQRVGSYLLALPKKVEEKFKSVVNSGKLPGRSVTLDKKNFSLKNISFLPPEVPPAVDGLGAYSFSVESKDETGNMNLQLNLPDNESHFADIEEDNIEFAEYEVSKYPFRTIKNIFRNIKNYFIEKDGQEKADQLMPEYLMEEVGNPPYVWEKKYPSGLNSFSQNIKDDKMNKIELSKVTDPQLRAAIEHLQNDNTKLNTDLQAATTKLSDAEKASLKNEVLQFCSSDDVKLKVVPAIKDKVVNLLMTLKEKGTIEFSAANNTTVKMDLFEFGKELVKMLPDAVELVELATKEKAGEKEPDYLKTAKEIATYANR